MCSDKWVKRDLIMGIEEKLLRKFERNCEIYYLKWVLITLHSTFV